MSQDGKKSTELIPGLPGVDAEDLLGMAAVCALGYLFMKRPELARTALQLVDQLFRGAPAPPKSLPPVALETVQQRLEDLRGPPLAKPRRRRRR